MFWIRNFGFQVTAKFVIATDLICSVGYCSLANASSTCMLILTLSGSNYINMCTTPFSSELLQAVPSSLPPTSPINLTGGGSGFSSSPASTRLLATNSTTIVTNVSLRLCVIKLEREAAMPNIFSIASNGHANLLFSGRIRNEPNEQNSLTWLTISWFSVENSFSNKLLEST